MSLRGQMASDDKDNDDIKLVLYFKQEEIAAHLLPRFDWLSAKIIMFACFKIQAHINTFYVQICAGHLSKCVSKYLLTSAAGLRTPQYERFG